MTTFTANGEYLVGGTTKDVRVWRVADGKQVAKMGSRNAAKCVAASKDGRWIAAGSEDGDVFVWRATTYEQVFADRTGYTIWDVDFSPDSTRLVSANHRGKATICDIAARRLKVRTLDHVESIFAAKYSPLVDRIATATFQSVRVWDSSDGRLLVDVKVPVDGLRRLLWCNHHLFVLTKDKNIKQINAVTGSTVSEWSVPGADDYSHIALPQHGKFIAHSEHKTITFWDTAKHTELSRISHTHNLFSFAFPRDDSLLAIVPVGSKIIVKELFQSVLVRSMSYL